MVNLRRSIDTRAVALLLLLPAVTACSGDDEGGAAPDEALAGLWRLAPDGAVTALYGFDTDGSFSFDEPAEGNEGEHIRGTYTAADGVLRMDGEDAERGRGRAEATYHVAGDRLAIGAYLPVGEHDGRVGVWAARSVGESLDDRGEVTEQGGFDIELELRGDGSLLVDLEVFDEDGSTRNDADGTWTEAGDTVSLAFSFVEGETIDVDLLVMGDDALGEAVLDRVGPAVEDRTAAARAGDGPDPASARRPMATPRWRAGLSVAEAVAAIQGRE